MFVKLFYEGLEYMNTFYYLNGELLTTNEIRHLIFA